MAISADLTQAEVVDRVTELVRPWLRESDSWRVVAGVPAEDDLLVALSRVRRQSGAPSLHLTVDVAGPFLTVSEVESDAEGTDYSVALALTRLLFDDLSRTCAACTVVDGHDWQCPIHLAELGITADEARRLQNQEEARIVDLRRPAQPRLTVVRPMGEGA